MSDSRPEAPPAGDRPTARHTPDPVVLERALKVLRPLQLYHRHSVAGLEQVPLHGPVLMVVHHSLATYDGFLLGLSIFEATGRAPRGLGDDLIFRIPGLGDLGEAIGLVPASPQAGHELLAQGELLGVAPGGMRESLRPSDRRYRVDWDDRRGFVRLALKAGAPLLMAACPKADDIFTVYPSRLTELAYEKLHIPVPLLRGLGLSALPRPVRLTHYLAPPIQPPVYDPEREEEQVEALFAACRRTMEALLYRRDEGVPVFRGAPRVPGAPPA
jgi:1-acyl-sn-glycerol-3-phosphate acyltransferase